jgi:hypothetical protein
VRVTRSPPTVLYRMSGTAIQEVSIADCQLEDQRNEADTTMLIGELARNAAPLARTRLLPCVSQTQFAALLRTIRELFGLKMLGKPTAAQLHRELREAEAATSGGVIHISDI